MGPLEGMTAAEIKQKYPEFHREWQAGQRRIPFPDEEGRDAFQGRLCDFLQELQARQPDGRVIVVTHGGALNMIVATVMQLDMERRFPFWFDNASISILEFGGHMPRVLGLNDICHLRHGSSNPTPEQQAVQDAKSTGQIDWRGSTASESSEAG